MVATGLPYAWPRSPATIGACETPRPSTKRPPDSSPTVCWIARMVIASRA